MLVGRQMPHCHPCTAVSAIAMNAVCHVSCCAARMIAAVLFTLYLHASLAPLHNSIGHARKLLSSVLAGKACAYHDRAVLLKELQHSTPALTRGDVCRRQL